MTTDDRRALLRAALTPDASVQAPPDLADAIQRAVLVAPQRRAGLWPAIDRLPGGARALLLVGLLGLVVVGALVALARPPAPPRLVTYHGGPERTGVSPGPAPSGQPVVEWDVSRPGPIEFGVMPLVADGMVVVADTASGLAALDESTGTERWRASIEGAVRGTPVIVGDVLIAGTDTGTLAAFNLADGAQLWHAKVGSPITGSLIEADGLVYVADAGGTLSAWDAATGERQWSLELGGPVTHGTAIEGGVLYAGVTGIGLVAIDLRTHDTRWTRPLGAGDFTTPMVGDGRVYVGRGIGTGGPRDLVAIDARNGEQVWVFASPEDQQVVPGALAGGVAFAVAGDGNLTALDAATGSTIWTAATGGSIGTGATVVDDEVFVTSENRLVHAFSTANGTERWKVPVSGSPTTPSVIDGRVVVGTNLGSVVSFADAH